MYYGEVAKKLSFNSIHCIRWADCTKWNSKVMKITSYVYEYIKFIYTSASMIAEKVVNVCFNCDFN